MPFKATDATGQFARLFALVIGALVLTAYVFGASPARADSVVSTISSVPSGINETQIVVSPDGDRLYVASGNTGVITAVDAASRTIVGTLSVGASAGSIAVSPDGARLYVTRGEVDSVAVIDTASLTVLATVAVLNNPASLAMSPDGTKVYVSHANVSSGAPSVAVIDTETNSVVSTVTTPSATRAIAVSPDGTRVYAAHFLSSMFDVSVIDTSTNTVVDTVLVGSAANRLESLAFAPDGSVLLGTMRGANSVAVIATDSNSVTHTIPVGATPASISVTADGTRAYVANVNDNTVSVVDMGSYTVASTVAVGSAPRSVTTSADNRFAYVTDREDSTVSVIALDTFPVIVTEGLPNGIEGGGYTATIVAEGSPSPVFAVTGGSLPGGLILDPATGEIAGSPVSAGSYAFTVTASSSVSGIASASSREYRVVIAAAAIVPSAPLDLSADLTDGGVDLVWAAPSSDGGSLIMGYRIERSTNGGPFVPLVTDTDSTATVYRDTTVASGAEYAYRVFALNGLGISAASNIDTVTVPDASDPSDPVPVTGEASGDAEEADRALASTGGDARWLKFMTLGAVFMLAVGVGLVRRRQLRRS